MVAEGKFALDGLGRVVGEQVLPGKRGIRALLQAHPAVSPQEDGVPHSSCRNGASPHCKGGRMDYSVGLRVHNCMLKRMEAEVMRVAEVPKPPQERGGGALVRIQGRTGSLQLFHRDSGDE